MAKSPGNKQLSEVLTDFLSGCARFVFVVGGVAAMVAAAFLVVTVIRVSGDASINQADALKNVETFAKVLAAGLLGVGVGSAYLYWGEEIVGGLQLVAGAILWFAPIYIPLLTAVRETEAVGRAFGALQTGGAILGGIGVIVVVIDLAGRVRQRSTQGIKADQLKFGKNIKEDADKQNVFLGKCWQLPFCRKFVRDRCPIYHAKRTCWRERVGCMCEEDVIRGAMENRPIAKDELLAARMIPRNNKLTLEAKKERCRNCVIYNEHQKHKYRLMLPLTLLVFIGFYALFRVPLLAATNALVSSANKVVQMGTLNAIGGLTTPPLFLETLLVIFMVVLLTYSLKMLEYLIFKLKI